MAYKEFTLEDRYTILSLRIQGVTTSEIAEKLGRHRCTIYLEVKGIHVLMVVIDLQRFHQGRLIYCSAL